jgi:hypothetical protein
LKFSEVVYILVVKFETTKEENLMTTIPATLEESGKTLYKEYLQTKKESLDMRAKVDRVEKNFLSENEWFEKRTGKRIFEPGRAYLVADIEGYCNALEVKKREAGLMEGIEAGYCPALILENKVIEIEWKILKWTEDLLGESHFAERVNIWTEKRKMAIELFLRLFMRKV